MAKSKEKKQALKLRLNGESIRLIARKTGVAKSTVSFWCRDIVLRPEQIEVLQKRMINKGSYEARLRGARIQHERRLEQIKRLEEEGFRMVSSLSKSDLLLIGAGLYWGEGMKKEGRARLANSDPLIIKFIIDWFKIIWGVSKERLTLSVLINKIHKERVSRVVQYWSALLDIPSNQFTKTTLIKTKNKKIYSNLEDHYGTIIVSVRRGGDLRHKINGLIKALSYLNRKPA